MLSSPLPYFIKPLDTKLAHRTLLAHTVRGIAWQLTSPAKESIARHRLDFAFVLGLSPHIRWYAAPSNSRNKLPYYFVEQILNHAWIHWKRGLSELDLNAIELALVRLLPHDLEYVMLMLTSQLIDSFNSLFFSERYAIMKPNTTIPQDVMDKLTMSLASLEQALLDKDPLMPQHLRSTHSLLITYPETVHLLDDAEIARIIDGAEILTKTEIVKATATKAAGSRKKLTADEL